MVVGELPRLQVDHEKLLPVGAATRDAISGPSPVVRETQSLQCHRSVTAQLIGIQEYACLTVELILHIDHTLVLQPVVT